MNLVGNQRAAPLREVMKREVAGLRGGNYFRRAPAASCNVNVPAHAACLGHCGA